jgi:ABC-type nitrate/sulfonate/bicarbonate transport system substrate-binding protein
MATDPLRQAALENGAAQAAVLTVPFNIKLEREGYPRLLNYGEGDLVRIPVGGLSSTVDYLTRNEDVVVRTLRATLRGQRDTRENRPVAVAALMDFYKIDEATAATIYDAAAPTYLPDGRMPVSVIQDTLETADESARNADPNALVDFRYLERATATLNAQPR